MSIKKGFLSLRLVGPLQSWGFDSQFSRRNTGLMPTKSAIAGICCAALGYPRGGQEEQKFLNTFAKLRMTSIALPRKCMSGVLAVRRLQDYHTVQNTRTADGKIKSSHITLRQYLTDASFGVLVEGEQEPLTRIAAALAEPKWGIWLGRKACIPCAPVLAGLRDSREEALRLLIGEESIESFLRQEEVEEFSGGVDSLCDNALSFALERRSFSPRRIRILQPRTVSKGIE